MIRILLVDDESIIREGIETMIPYDSLNLSLTGSCTNAIEALESMADNMPDILVTDIRMPEMDGIEAAKIIKTAKPKLPIIAQTCHESDIDQTQISGTHFDGFISKPININKLIEMVDRKL